MIRKPLQTVYSTNVTSTSNSSAVFNLAFLDIDGLVVKASGTFCSNVAGSIDMWLSTSDDGGTTFYDMARLQTIGGNKTNASALWFPIPLTGGFGGKYPGDVGYQTLGGATGANYAGAVSGLPVLSPTMKLTWLYSGLSSSTAANWTVTISANSQSGVGY